MKRSPLLSAFSFLLFSIPSSLLTAGLGFQAYPSSFFLSLLLPARSIQWPSDLGEMMGGQMVVFMGYGLVRCIWVCVNCVQADGMRIKTQMALSELNVTVEKIFLLAHLWAAQNRATRNDCS